MSQSTAARPARPAPRPPGGARPTGRVSVARLRVVAPPTQARSRAGLVVGCLAVLTLGLVGLLLLNVNLEKGAFVRRQQQAQLERLREQRQALQEDLDKLQAPQALAARAAQLGMVQPSTVAFVTKDGRILGVPSRASAPPTPTVDDGTGSSPAPDAGGSAAADGQAGASAAAPTAPTTRTTTKATTTRAGHQPAHPSAAAPTTP